MDDVLAKKWSVIYRQACADELRTTGWDEATFAKFCDALSQYGWPKDDYFTIEEAYPSVNVPSENGIGTDTSWEPSARHRYAVTIRKKSDHSSQMVVVLNYRHNRNGDWNPDVLSIVVDISRAMPASRAPAGILAALKAIGKDQVTIYPLGQQTNVKVLKELQAGKKVRWLWMTHQEFH
ncbi:MAG TPA: hypothetical protein VG944_10860 [Fimbriimonas sp.]|nr:hypothetical protein [Fimbriimonas sp.]